MSSQSPSADGSDREQDQQVDADVATQEKDDADETVIGARESADGGASPQQQPLETDPETNPDTKPGTEPHEEAADEDKGSIKEQSNEARDLDKDIDAVLEYNVKNGQVDPEMSVTIDNIEVDSTLDAKRNAADDEESGADGMPSATSGHDSGQQPFTENVDMNGNVATVPGDFESQEGDELLKPKESGLDKSFTSDTTTDSSVVAETLVKNALNVAVTAMRSEEDDGGVVKEMDEKEQEADTGIAASAAGETVAQGDTKVGLFQYDFGDDYQAENGGYEDEDTDDKEDETDDHDRDGKQENDPQVGLFQYQEPADTEKDKSPDVSDTDTIEDQIDSMTEEEKSDIMTLYGLDTMETIYPKSSLEKIETVPEAETNDNVIDVQRDVYEPQTKIFSITRDPSSSESTPRNGPDRIVAESKPVEVREESKSHDVIQQSQVEDVLSDKEEAALSDSDSGRASNSKNLMLSLSESNSKEDIPEQQQANDAPVSYVEPSRKEDQPSPYIEPIPSQEIAPPLVHYEPVKENGKFRIIKTSKEGGGSAFSGIRVGRDVSTPEQSPRSGSEDGQKSDRSHTSDRSQKSDRSQLSHQSEGSQTGQKADMFRSSAKEMDASPRSVTSPPVQVAQEIPQRRSLESDQDRHEKDQASAQALDRPPATATEGESVSLASSTRSQTSERKTSKDLLEDSWKWWPENSNGQAGFEGELKERSPQQLRDTQQAENQRAWEAERERIKYTTRNTDGVETRRTGPVPYDMGHDRDRDTVMGHDRDRDTVMGHDRDRDTVVGHDRDRDTVMGHDRDRDTVVGHDRDRDTVVGQDRNRDRDRVTVAGARPSQSCNKDRYESVPDEPSGQYSASYREELIQSAYSRLPPALQTSQDPRSRSLPGRAAPGAGVDTGVIPGFKTLQEQQASWSGMFRQLEDQHRRELRSQYDHHQYNITRLQREMELELQKQHAAIRNKLELHREKLDQMASPERVEPPQRGSQGRRVRAGDTSPSPDRGQSSMDDGSRDRRERSQSEESRTWREIYREVRAEEEDSDSAPPATPPIKRALDDDFAALDNTANDTHASRLSESQRSRGSQLSTRPADRGLSDERSRERSYERSRDRSLERSRTEVERSRSAMPEKEVSRSAEKEARSRSHRPNVSPRSPRVNREDEGPQTIGQFAAESVSQHIQQLLDNLHDTRTSLRHIEGDASADGAGDRGSGTGEESRPRAGVYSSPMPMFKGSRGTKTSPKAAHNKSKNASTSREPRLLDQSGHSLDQSRLSADQSRTLGDQSRISSDQSRISVDQSRIMADQSRLSADQSRLLGDQSRISADQSRILGDQSRISGDQSRVSLDQSRLSSLFEDRAELHEDSLLSRSERQRREKDRASESHRGEDLGLSSRERLNLREKHSKHLADLRAYYEDEVRELRKALTDSLDTSGQLGGAADRDASTLQSAVQGQLLEAENKHLLDKCRTMEDELEELYARVRILEQKNLGLEKRASEYAGAFTESKTMAIQHQAHIEELQRYCRERDDIVAELESKVTSQEDSVKIYKKSLDEELELHRQDKMALQRIIDKYDGLEREYKLLQETMSTTESRLYETRTEIVELNRTISKMELENKRIGRENDNLRHKITQSLNLSVLHESFGSPSSPRSAGVGQISPANIIAPDHHKPTSSSVTAPALSTQPRLQTTAPALSAQQHLHTTAQALSNQSDLPTPDRRLPAFATSTLDWSSSSQRSKSRTQSHNQSHSQSHSQSQNQSRSKPSTADRIGASGRQGSSDSLSSSQMKGESSSKSKKRLEPKGSNSSRTRSQREDGGAKQKSQSRPEQTNGDVEHQPTRDRAPAARDQSPLGAPSEASLADSDNSDFSPLLKAERELFKLRDMMRHAVAVKPSASPPPEPKLQKKFYGSERPGSKDDYHPDLGTSRGRKEKPAANSHSTVPKSSKSGPQLSKSDKSGDRSSKKSSKSDREDRAKDRSDRSDRRQRDTRERTGDQEDQRAVTPTKKHFSVNSDAFDSPTRFDININDDHKSVSVSQKKADSGASKVKPSTVSRANQTREETPGAANGDRGDNHVSGANGQLEGTLDRVRGGQYMTRPEWEDVYTSLAKPRPEHQDKIKAMTKEEKIKDRLRTISEMESRYDGLQVEKRQLESSINKIPLHGRVDRNNRRHKEEMEERLDSVEKELGSLRMSLKRYNVLKTAG